MIDKEIIIDGVNVSRCENIESHSLNPITLMNEFLLNPMCRAYQNRCEGHNCYFKQLSRKTTECEKYEQVLDEIKKYFKSRDTSKTSLFNIFYVEAEILNIINKAKDGK